jgi:outer membrane receptor protein involved in Fe transport
MSRLQSIATLLAGASALAFPLIARAQAGTSEIVVTGSRVIQNGNNSPTPVTVVSTENLQNIQPTTLMDALNNLPVFSGSRTQQSNLVSSGIAGAGAPASNQLTLRNLGANKTLVLFDGQRVTPTTITNVVDADIIPQMLIQRVDIVTGGVSAVYGSDAIVGVVNFVPDKTFNGLKIEAQDGASGHGDNRNWKAGIAVGTRLFDGKGHIEASYQHYNDDGILDRYSRSWNTKWGVTGTGTAANPYVLQNNLRNNQATFGGLITNGVLKGMAFSSNGVLTPFVHGAATGTTTAEIGGDGYYNDASMVAPLRFDQLYVRADYDFGDGIHGHIQASRDSKWNSQLTSITTDLNQTLSSTNPFLPAVYQAQLAAAKQSTFTLSEAIAQEPKLTTSVTSDQYIVNAGLDGALGKYRWGLAFNYGTTTLHDLFHYNQNNDHLAAALDAVINPANGQVVCNSDLTNPGLRPGCAPLNLFGPSSASQAALNYVFEDINFIAHTTTYDVNGNIAGEPFSTPAGPVSVALSGDWRRESFNSWTDAPSAAGVDCTTVRFNCTSTTVLWQNTFGASPTVSESVWETAFEAEVPLLKDAPFAQAFNVNGAVRYTNYSVKGAYWTWKVGMDWHVDEQLRFRGTVSRDIRAPNLNELFSPLSIQITNSQDLLTLLTPSLRQFRAGNPNLLAEIGDTKTIGFVFQPHWLPRFSLSVDAFHITVQNAIVDSSGNSAALQQVCYASGGTSPYCSLQARPLGFTNTTAANVVTAWYDTYLNISSIETYGADVEANYAGLALGHRYALRTFLTWQPHTLYTQPGADTIDMGGTAYGPTPLIANPSFRLTASESVDVTDAFRVDLVERYRNSLRLNGDSILHVACCLVAPVAYLDINLTYKLTSSLGQAETFLNIQNVFDQNPPPSAPPGNSTPGPMGGWALGDDPIGRAFLIGLRFKH